MASEHLLMPASISTSFQPDTHPHISLGCRTPFLLGFALGRSAHRASMAAHLFFSLFWMNSRSLPVAICLTFNLNCFRVHPLRDMGLSPKTLSVAQIPSACVECWRRLRRSQIGASARRNMVAA